MPVLYIDAFHTPSGGIVKLVQVFGLDDNLQAKPTSDIRIKNENYRDKWVAFHIPLPENCVENFFVL
jgi:hypothetical protein